MASGLFGIEHSNRTVTITGGKTVLIQATQPQQLVICWPITFRLFIFD